MTPEVTAVIVAYGEEPWLEDAVDAVAASAGVTTGIVVVDNGCTSDAVAQVAKRDAVQVVRPGANTGFAGGCARGAAVAAGEYLAFVNSDAIVAPGALRQLAAVAAEPGVGMAMGSIRLAGAPDVMNTAGNPLHVTGLSWAGAFGEPASRHTRRRPVPVGSGCCFVMRRSVWEDLGGFAEAYFLYHEDTELSLRVWQRGLTVEYVPDAVVWHHYEFARNEQKLYLAERNREIMLLTAYQRRTLLLLAPVLLLTEVLLLTAGAVGGWGRAKLHGWRWIWRHRDWIRARREHLQRQRAVPDRVVLERATARIDAGNVAAPPGTGLFNVIVSGYWSVARRLL